MAQKRSGLAMIAIVVMFLLGAMVTYAITNARPPSANGESSEQNADIYTGDYIVILAPPPADAVILARGRGIVRIPTYVGGMADYHWALVWHDRAAGLSRDPTQVIVYAWK